MSKVAPVVPIFIGGTGRSGTTILGDLLGAHPSISLSKPTEIKFLSNAPGLLNRAFGNRGAAEVDHISFLHPRARYQRAQRIRAKRTSSIEEFLQLVDQRWWKIDAPAPHGPGLIEGITQPQWDALTAPLLKNFPKKPIKASATFLTNYIRAQSNWQGERYWAETTPFNIREADRISTLIPESLFIHMARDPRDVIASLLTKNWGPTTPLEGISWVEERLIAGHRALAAIDSSKVLHLSLEELISDGPGSISAILNFLSLEPSAEMADFYATNISSEGAKSGRWREEIEETAFEEAFEAMCQRLDREGVRYYRQ